MSDRAIGIALGIVLGLAIVIAFVFLGSGDTIDDPSLSGSDDEQPALTQPATPPDQTQPAAPPQQRQPDLPGESQPPATTTQP